MCLESPLIVMITTKVRDQVLARPTRPADISYEIGPEVIGLQWLLYSLELISLFPNL